MTTGANTVDRIQREKEFHNQWARSVKLEELLVRESFEAPTAIENQHALHRFGDLKGKRLLDLGCGAGETSVYFALCGAEVYACDISDQFLKVAEALAAKFGVGIQTAPASANQLPYKDGMFDFVFGNGILHHVELESTAQEIRRVLKVGGMAVFVEPLPYNPVINVYRHMAKEVRSEDERPLSFSQLRRVGSFFSSFSHREYWFLTLLIFVYFYFVKRWHPSKVRYWKKVIEEGESYRQMFTALQKADEVILTISPFLRPLCWNTVLTLVK